MFMQKSLLDVVCLAFLRTILVFSWYAIAKKNNIWICLLTTIISTIYLVAKCTVFVSWNLWAANILLITSFLITWLESYLVLSGSIAEDKLESRVSTSRVLKRGSLQNQDDYAVDERTPLVQDQDRGPLQQQTGPARRKKHPKGNPAYAESESGLSQRSSRSHHSSRSSRSRRSHHSSLAQPAAQSRPKQPSVQTAKRSKHNKSIHRDDYNDYDDDDHHHHHHDGNHSPEYEYVQSFNPNQDTPIYDQDYNSEEDSDYTDSGGSMSYDSDYDSQSSGHSSYSSGSSSEYADAVDNYTEIIGGAEVGYQDDLLTNQSKKEKRSHHSYGQKTRTQSGDKNRGRHRHRDHHHQSQHHHHHDHHRINHHPEDNAAYYSSSSDSDEVEIEIPSLKPTHRFADDLEQMFDELEDAAREQDGWESLGDNDGVTIDVKTMEDGSNCMRGVTEMAAPAWAIMNFMRDLECKKTWDELFERGEEIETVDDFCSVSRQCFYARFPADARDFVLLGTWKEDEDGTIMQVARSVQHPDCPEDPNYVRAHIFVAGYVFEPLDQDSSLVTYVVHMSPGGSVPQFLVNQVSKQQPMSLAKVRTAIEQLNPEQYPEEPYDPANPPRLMREKLMQQLQEQQVRKQDKMRQKKERQRARKHRQLAKQQQVSSVQTQKKAQKPPLPSVPRLPLEQQTMSRQQGNRRGSARSHTSHQSSSKHMKRSDSRGSYGSRGSNHNSINGGGSKRGDRSERRRSAKHERNDRHNSHNSRNSGRLMSSDRQSHHSHHSHHSSHSIDIVDKSSPQTTPQKKKPRDQYRNKPVSRVANNEDDFSPSSMTTSVPQDSPQYQQKSKQHKQHPHHSGSQLTTENLRAAQGERVNPHPYLEDDEGEEHYEEAQQNDTVHVNMSGVDIEDQDDDQEEEFEESFEYRYESESDAELEVRLPVQSPSDRHKSSSNHQAPRYGQPKTNNTSSPPTTDDEDEDEDVDIEDSDDSDEEVSLFEEYTEMIEEAFEQLEGYAYQTENWEDIGEFDGVDCKKMMHENGNYVLRGEGIIHAPAWACVNYAVNMDKKPEWDKNFDTGEVLAEFDGPPAIKVFRFCMHKVFPTTERDSVTITCQRLNLKTKAYMGVATSVDWEARPIGYDQYVRSTVYVAGYVATPLEDDDTSCNFKIIIHMSPGGLIPDFIVNKVVKQQPMKVDDIRQQMEDMDPDDYLQFPFSENSV
eukprot:TRINITY_DN2718_c0_g4_i3.p1 TRINITY_DN2718_c0_g4~~TRINITY_DN2718_c0_g4_i3.p1  ORF type:complete len:1271 (+),score=381.45 TRINITY_DN2718_c0_g4_i3:206-3814(+)